MEFQVYNMPCQFPYQVQNPLPVGFSTIPVPCGKCYDCKMRMATQWAFRLSQEEKQCTSSHFVTLTYDTENVPITKKGYMSLDIGKHLQNFFKTLRNQYRYKKINPETGKLKYYYDQVPKIKYFAVGEYGFQKDRPHYHVILLNSHENLITDSWRYGQVHIGKVQQASIMYCLKYVLKDGKIPKHKNDDRVPEYRRSSIKLGINYLTPEIIKYHRNNPKKAYITLEGGFKVAIPRYFRNKIWTELELQKINEIIARNLEQINELAEKKFLNENEKNHDYHGHLQSTAEYKHQRAIDRAKKTRN